MFKDIKMNINIWNISWILVKSILTILHFLRNLKKVWRKFDQKLKINECADYFYEKIPERELNFIRILYFNLKINSEFA